MLHLLGERSACIEAPCRRVAALLLRHYGEHGEFPSIRTLARAAHTSRSSADRRYTVVMQAWRRILAASELRAGGAKPSKRGPLPCQLTPSAL